MDDETREQFRRIIDVVIERTSATDEKLLAFREELDGKIEDLRDEMLTNFDALFKRDEDRQMEYQAIKAALSRVELSEVSIDARVAVLEAALRGDLGA